MACVWKHPQSKYWIARFATTAGARRNRSTRETDRPKAQRIADSYEEAARRKQTARQVRRVIASLRREITGQDATSPSLNTFIDSWLARKTPETAPGTVAFYRNALGKFTKFLGTKAESEITEITRDEITAFRNAQAQGLAAKTVNHSIKIVKMLFRAARRDGVLSDDPSEFVDTIRARSGRPRRVFTIPELQAILGVADEEWRSMILFGLYTGQRLGDIAMLIWQNVDLVNEEIRLTTRKTGKTQLLPIAPPLKKHLEQLPSSDELATPIHPRAFATLVRQGKTGNLSNQFADILADAGLRPKKPHRGSGVGRGHGSGNKEVRAW
jgi:integrase